MLGESLSLNAENLFCFYSFVILFPLTEEGGRWGAISFVKQRHSLTGQQEQRQTQRTETPISV